MGTHFDAAVDVVLKHEGGFVDDPDDPGGATNYGISLRWALGEVDEGDALDLLDFDGDGDVDPDDIRRMRRQDAIAIYREFFWRDVYDRLGDRRLAIRVFDTAVNMGHKQAHRILQRALRAATGRDIDDDGLIGPQTLGALPLATVDAILAAFRAEQAGFYRSLAAQRPRLEKFLRGWLNRAYEVV